MGIEGASALRTDIHESNLDEFIREHAIAIILVYDKGGAQGDLLTQLAGVCAAAPLPTALAAVDATRAPGVLAQFGVSTPPYLLLLRERIALYAEALLPSVEGLRQLLAQVLTLDMDQVRAELAVEREAREAMQIRRACPTLRSGPAITRD